VSQGGGTLAVVAGSETVALVDTQSFQVSDPPEPGEPTSSEPAEERGEFVAWALLGAAGAILAVGGLVLAAHQRFAKRRLRSRASKPGEVLGGIGDEVEVELRDPLLDDSPHGLTEVGHEAHEAERSRVLVP
jgi:hypothetical protein